MAQRKPGKRYFGNVRELPSGSIQARYTGPDGRTYTARTPEGRPLTFDTQGDAGARPGCRYGIRRSCAGRGCPRPSRRPPRSRFGPTRTPG